nr:multiple epidermal growth factor-like domains protein 11 [Lytechinus pictus]
MELWNSIVWRGTAVLLFLTTLYFTRGDASLSLDVDGSHVCTITESYFQTMTASYREPFDQTYYTKCTDITNWFKCTRRRTRYRVRYRQEVRTRYRKLRLCCSGYHQRENMCIPICSSPCVHGTCSVPDLCTCEAGYRGDTCESTCPDKRWGSNCLNRCQCLTEHHVTRTDGSCSCQAGFSGPTCSDPCPANTYGPGCLLECQCENGGRCDSVTGACSCPPGYRLPL